MLEIHKIGPQNIQILLWQKARGLNFRYLFKNRTYFPDFTPFCKFEKLEGDQAKTVAFMQQFYLCSNVIKNDNNLKNLSDMMPD